MRRLLALLTVLPLAAAAQDYGNDAPQPPPPAYYPQGPQAGFADPTIHRHLGFFIRPEVGLGYAYMTSSSGGVDMTVKGGGGAFGIAVGGAMSENFILGFQAWDVVAMSPTVEMSGGGTTLSGSTSSDTTAGIVGYGLLLNWYTPGNTYVAVTPSLTRLALSTTSGNANSEWGFGVRAALGKEWWVSNHWGLGLGAALALSSNKDSGGSGAPTFTSLGFSVNFSATFN